MTAQCANCRYWRLNERIDGIGECRAGLPIFRSTGSDIWPATNADAWCAHHQPTIAQAKHGDHRPGAAEVLIGDNGIVQITYSDGETLELSALEGLTERDKETLARMAWESGE